jgi:hypothetical protein
MKYPVGTEVQLADGRIGGVIATVTRRRPDSHAMVQFSDSSSATYSFEELQAVEEIGAPNKTVKPTKTK